MAKRHTHTELVQDKESIVYEEKDVLILLQMLQEEIRSELEFEDRKKKIEAFKDELKALMTKYNFGKYESMQYNGMEEYCGSDYYFIVDGEKWYDETIEEILHSVGLNMNKPTP